MINNLKDWTVTKKTDHISSLGIDLETWNIKKANIIEDKKHLISITNAPLQWAVAWLIHNDIVYDINHHIFTLNHQQNVDIDLDW